MNIQACAQAAVAQFPDVTVATTQGTLPLRSVMVAIGGAESGWDPSAAGDPCSSYPAAACCEGNTSFGWLQYHLVYGARTTWLTQATGSADPCAWAGWLQNQENCARACWVLISGNAAAGLTNWSTYNDGGWWSFYPQAQAAVAAAQSTGPPAGAPPPSQPTTGASPLVLAALAVLVLAAGDVGAAEVRAHPAWERWIRSRYQHLSSDIMGRRR